MFTGIVQCALPVARAENAGRTRRLGIEFPPDLRAGLEIGASVSINGVCLTVSWIETACVWFDLIGSTLDRTNLATVGIGDAVNIERSLRADSELGGHHLSGHVDATAGVTGVDTSADNWRISLTVDPEFIRYLFPRGFVALNGVSLTLGEVDHATNGFEVWLIPETLRRTNLGGLRDGARVNLEIDRATQVMVETIERTTRQFLEEAVAAGRIGVKG